MSAPAPARPALSLAKKRGYHHGDLPRALVAAAVELIDKKGVESFTLREAAALVGVTHGAAYRHFADKTALLAAVAEEGFRMLLPHVEAAAKKSQDPASRISAIASAYVAFAVDRPAHYEVMTGPRLNEDGRFPTLEAAIDEVFGAVVREIERGQEAGAFRAGAPRDLAVGVWVAAHGYADLVHARRIKVRSPTRYFERLLPLVIDGLVR